MRIIRVFLAELLDMAAMKPAEEEKSNDERDPILHTCQLTRIGKWCDEVAYTTPSVTGSVMLFDCEGFPHCPDVSFSVQTELSEAPRLTISGIQLLVESTTCSSRLGRGSARGAAARRRRRKA